MYFSQLIDSSACMCTCVLSVPAVGVSPWSRGHLPNQDPDTWEGHTVCSFPWRLVCVCLSVCVCAQEALNRSWAGLGIQDQLQQRLPKATYSQAICKLPIWMSTQCVLETEAQPCCWVDLGTQSSSSSLTSVKPPLQQL